MLQKKLILLEVNEVPFRIIDGYCRRCPDSTLARMLAASKTYVSITEDRLVLDPWTSWPTLHRGVTDETHNILHLGQVVEETDDEFPPIWRLLKSSGLSVGVFGSLHSSSVPADATSYSFYLPDYFESEPMAHPKNLLPFQALNLSMTRQSARNVSRKIPLGAAAKFALAAPGLGLRAATIVDSFGHLWRECFDASLRIRRRVYQPLIMMDLFMKQLTRTKPQFASFYTNHVAAAMHRYWAATFPEDYPADQFDDEWVARYRGEIWFAMDKLDLMLRRVKGFVDANLEYTLVVASSMGQAAIAAQKTHEFLTITNIDKFMAALGVPSGAWTLRPAMVPCVCVMVEGSYRDVLDRNVETLTVGETTVTRSKRPVGPMSFDERQRGFFQFFIQFDNYRGSDQASVQGHRHRLEDMGLGFMAHEDGVNCTAQHVPDGSVFVYPAAGRPDGSAERGTVSTIDVAPSILRFFGLGAPSYMRGASTIELERTTSA